MTKTEYKEYEESVAYFFEKEGVNSLTCDDSEAHFSHRSCECCGSHLGGDRYQASGYHPEAKEVFKYEVCPDCLYYVEYGQLDDMTLMDMED